jgi:hypothetical protein
MTKVTFPCPSVAPRPGPATKMIWLSSPTGIADENNQHIVNAIAIQIAKGVDVGQADHHFSGRVWHVLLVVDTVHELRHAILRPLIGVSGVLEYLSGERGNGGAGCLPSHWFDHHLNVISRIALGKNEVGLGIGEKWIPIFVFDGDF